MTMFRRNKSLVAFIMSLVLLLAAGCGSASAEATLTTYDDYQFWEQENMLRIVVPMPKDTLGQLDDQTGIEGIGELELSSKYLKRAEVLKEAMISYFSEEYDIDISEELANQKLRVFKASGENEGLMGYVDKSQPEYLNLNKDLFGEYKVLFDHTYVHETLHQIGFFDLSSDIIVEGLVDALTDLILNKAGIESYPTPTYGSTRALGYQILEADKGIVEYFLLEENSNMILRINTVLENVERPCNELADVGTRLEKLLVGLTYGIETTFNVWYVAFEAQEIVRAYCQEFEPDEETIDNIRSYYIVADYEAVVIEAIEGGYNAVLK